MIGIINPGSLKSDHLRSELNYAILERDISVCLSSFDGHEDDANGILADSWADVLRFFQRRMDNIEALAPPIPKVGAGQTYHTYQARRASVDIANQTLPVSECTEHGNVYVNSEFYTPTNIDPIEPEIRGLGNGSKKPRNSFG